MRWYIPIICVLLALATPAPSHSWYEPECCGGSDCFPLKDGQVKIVKSGYLVSIPDHGAVIVPYGEERPSQDEHYHLCWPSWSEKPRCFYAPPQGV